MYSPNLKFIYEISTSTVTLTAIARSIWLLVGIIRMLLLQRRASLTKWGWIEVCTFSELFFFFLATYVFVSSYVVPTALSLISLIGPITGALLALSGLLISLWSFSSFPKVSTGHYIENDHQVVTTGPYKFVRHPIYLGVFLIWFSLAIAFHSLVVCLFTVIYIIPIYTLYMRSEETMMLNELGNEYREYRDQVGMVIPRFRAHSR